MREAGRVHFERARRVGRALIHHDALGKASAMAFDAFMSLIPLLALAGFVLQRLHESGELFLMPLFATAPEAARVIANSEFLRLSETGRTALPPISLAVFLYVTSSGISTAMYELELIFAVPPRRWWVRRLIAAACVLGCLLALAVGASVTWLVVRTLGTVGATVVGIIVPTVALTAMMTAFFHLVVHTPTRALPGAIVTVALWGAASSLFSTYVRTLARYATLYGSLAAVAIVLFWLWLLSVAILVGGAVNAELSGLLEGPSESSGGRLR